MKYKDLQVILVDGNKAVCEGATTTEARNRGVNLKSATHHKNDIVAIKFKDAHNHSGAVNYGASFEIDCLLSDKTIINMYIDVIDVIFTLQQDKIEVIKFNGVDWVATPGAKLIMSASMVELALSPEIIDKHMKKHEKEIKESVKAAESANRLNSELKVGDFCKIPNVWSEVIFLGVFFGATTNIIEKKGYNLTRDERYTFKTTNTKKMYVFVSPELTKIEFRSNLNQVELINSGLPIYVDKANEILDLFDKDKELLLKTLLKQGVKDTYYKSRNGFDIRRKALLKPISFISMTKSKNDFKISSNLKMVELIKGINSLSAGRKIWDEKPENLTIADFSSDSKYDGPERKVLPLILELLNK